MLERLTLVCVPLLLLLGACDDKAAEQTAPVVATEVAPEAKPEADFELQPGKTAASLQLQAVVELVQGDTIADAKALEIMLNDPAAKLHAVDLDGDGVTDFVEVVEVQQGGKTILELRAIPSSKQDQDAAKVAVLVAKVELHVAKVADHEQIIVHATYTDHIEHDAVIHVYHHEQPAIYEHGVLVLTSGCFFHYVFVLEHELYLGHHSYLVIIEAPHHHYVKPKKHKKHKKHKHKHKHKGH